MVVFDIGAQAGYHTLLASISAGPNGRVYAFEPESRNLGYIRAHVALHNLTNVTVIDAAVSDITGVARFDPGPSCVAGHLSEQGSLSVRCVTLDDEVFSGRLPMPDLIKLDVEGAELRVLEGATGILRQRMPELVLDTHDFLGGIHAGLQQKCCAFLRDRGYQLTPISARTLDAGNEVHAVPA